MGPKRVSFSIKLEEVVYFEKQKHEHEQGCSLISDHHSDFYQREMQRHRNLSKLAANHNRQMKMLKEALCFVFFFLKRGSQSKQTPNKQSSLSTWNPHGCWDGCFSLFQV